MFEKLKAQLKAAFRSAGCIKDPANGKTDDTIIVDNANAPADDRVGLSRPSKQIECCLRIGRCLLYGTM